MNKKIIILRDELEVHYCDPITLDAIEVYKFISNDQLDNFIYGDHNSYHKKISFAKNAKNAKL